MNIFRQYLEASKSGLLNKAKNERNTNASLKLSLKNILKDNIAAIAECINNRKQLKDLLIKEGITDIFITDKGSLYLTDPDRYDDEDESDAYERDYKIYTLEGYIDVIKEMRMIFNNMTFTVNVHIESNDDVMRKLKEHAENKQKPSMNLLFLCGASPVFTIKEVS